MGVGISEIFILLGIFFGGSFGLPMGVAPGPEDPMMFKVAPAKCVFYASWTGIGELDKAANPTEAWMAQPEIQTMMVKLRTAYRGVFLNKEKQESAEPVVNALTKLLLRLAETSSRNPTAFYLTDFQIVDNKPVMEAGAIIGLGDQTDSIEKLLTAFNEELDKLEEDDWGFKRIEIDGQPAFHVEVPETGTEAYFGIRGKYFVMGLGKDSLSELARNSKTDAPQWLTAAREELPVKRFSSMTYLDTNAAIDLVKIGQPGLFPFRPIFDQVIGDDVDEIAWVSGIDDRGFLTRTSIHTAKELTGLLSVFEGKPISRKQLDDFPADATVGVATRFSTEAVLELVQNVAAKAGQKQTIDDALDGFQKFTGMTLKEEFLEAVGNYVYIYYKLDVAKPTEGWIGSIHIEDEMSFPSTFEEVNKTIERAIKQADVGIKFQKTEIDGNDFYSFSQDRWSQVTWGLVDDQWYFASTPDGIRKHLKETEKANRLSEHETVKAFFEFGDKSSFGGPIAILDLNLPAVLKAVWSFTSMIDKDQKLSDDFDFKFGDIPKLDVLINNVQPNLTAVYRTPDGFQIMQRQTYPGSSPGVTIVAASAIAMPSVAAQYESAKKVAVMNNMRQIALAAHNFESANESFPAAHTSDKDGTKLLSWRVHLLPFLGQSELYESFHLNEPWDSDHNKSLIAKMPDVYKHSSLKLSEGETVFLGVADVFAEPKKPGGKNAAGITTFGKIIDGSSNTAMVIEVNAANAVPWTKPEDLPADAEQVSKMTEGIRGEKKFMAAMCDGSVQVLPCNAIDFLKKVLTKAGGEVVEFPNLP